MKQFMRLSLAIATMMVLAACATAYLTPTKRLTAKEDAIDLEAAVPKQFGGWTMETGGVPFVPSEDTKELIARIYDQTLNRTYVNSAGERIMLSIAYGGSQTRQLRAHRQEVCYTAQGFQISQLEQANLQIGNSTIRGTRMLARQGDVRVEPVTYWFTMGDTVVQSYVDRQIAQLKYAMSGVIPDGYLYRVSSLSSNSAQAYAKQAAFSTELLSQVDPRLAQRLLGGASKR
ncbi:exosortase-associated protein EpsI, B-type [Duganella qianjiadongensis]|uniref:EpsI family protein n=1 Tax=Duganella qianjiadongensis TaxID=2692176 RepID=A0ABW9VR49_9BURK|nr:exosortase-associated protein EpsI, B-type [Duganella qianjiadongensis]MYM41656.1 EpsI family protein [Duganella qianjiadongensis]